MALMTFVRMAPMLLMGLPAMLHAQAEADEPATLEVSSSPDRSDDFRRFNRTASW